MSAFKSKRKSVEFEVNLTSFIDLLSTTVCFLLISAVWVQVASMEVKQSHGTEAQSLPSDSYEMELTFQSANELKLQVKKAGKIASTINLKEQDAKALAPKLDESIKTWVRSLGNVSVKIEAATVTPVKGVVYGQLIATMDSLRKNNIVNIGVIPAAGGR